MCCKNSIRTYLYKLCIICLQAFAWFSDLLVEHAEIFWALFAVDMDRILAEQPPDTWDTFPLFQILNDYLRLDGIFNIEKLHYSCTKIISLDGIQSVIGVKSYKWYCRTEQLCV